MVSFTKVIVSLHQCQVPFDYVGRTRPTFGQGFGFFVEVGDLFLSQLQLTKLVHDFFRCLLLWLGEDWSHWRHLEYIERRQSNG